MAHIVKICGVTTLKDVEVAANAGADLIGFICHPSSKRYVDKATIRQLSHAARRSGRLGVGVFVNQDADAINKLCSESELPVAQLHGDKAREALAKLDEDIRVIYAITAGKDGSIEAAHLPQGNAGRRIDFLLVDGPVPGSGLAFDWQQSESYMHSIRKRFGHKIIIAGGLDPDNVGAVVQQLNPAGVDVASGTAASDGVTKDPAKCQHFVANARQAWLTSG